MSQFRRFLKKEWIIPSAVGVVSFTAGLTTGLMIGKEIRKKQLEDISKRLATLENAQGDLENRQDETSSGFARTIKRLKEEWKESKLLEPEEILPPGDTGLRAPQPHPEYLEKLQQREEAREVFAHSDVAQWDYQEELAKRAANPGKPYIVHVDEFMAKEAEDYRQTTLEYYQGDDVLVDERDVPLYDADKIVGKANLIFGHGSNDPSIVYIRNDNYEAEYEVLLNEGRYAVEMLGVEDEKGEIQHSRRRRFIEED